MASLFGDSPKKKIFIGDKIISTALSRDRDREKYKKEEAKYYDTEIEAKEHAPGFVKKLMLEMGGEILKAAPDKGKCSTRSSSGPRG